ARSFAERLREAVEAASFEVRTSATPIRTTISLGVACFPWDATAPTDLIHESDVAVYHAKLKGRNCVVCASDVPHSIRLESAVAAEDRLASPYVPTFVPRPGLREVGMTPDADGPATSVGGKGRAESAGWRG
ncbi:MAG: diguanylate cyclase, partial [Anaerolineae bacterium]